MKSRNRFIHEHVKSHLLPHIRFYLVDLLAVLQLAPLLRVRAHHRKSPLDLGGRQSSLDRRLGYSLCGEGLDTFLQRDQILYMYI